MPRKAPWPPRVYSRRGADYVRLYLDGTAHEKKLGPTGSEESRSAYARFLSEHAAGKPPGKPDAPASPVGPTVAEAVAAWLEWLSANANPHGGEHGQAILAFRPVLRLYGDLPAARFGVDELEAVQAAMACGTWQKPDDRQRALDRGDPLDWSRRVVNRRIVRVRTGWRWLERRKFVPPGSWAALSVVRPLRKGDRRARELPRRLACEESDLMLVLDCLHEPIRTMLDLENLTGMRPAEVRTMRKGEVDCTGAVWVYRPGGHKMDHLEDDCGRAVPLGPRSQELLRPFLDAAAGPESYLFPPVGRMASRSHYAKQGYSQAVARACVKAGVKIVPYQCRHSAKKRITASHGLDAARALLGQRSLGTTNEYHGVIDLDTAKRIAAEQG